MIPGILFILLGLGAFILGGVQMNDAPGVDRKHLTTMVIGLVLLFIGTVLLYGNVFGG